MLVGDMRKSISLFFFMDICRSVQLRTILYGSGDRIGSLG